MSLSAPEGRGNAMPSLRGGAAAVPRALNGDARTRFSPVSGPSRGVALAQRRPEDEWVPLVDGVGGRLLKVDVARGHAESPSPASVSGGAGGREGSPRGGGSCSFTERSSSPRTLGQNGRAAQVARAAAAAAAAAATAAIAKSTSHKPPTKKQPPYQSLYSQQLQQQRQQQHGAPGTLCTNSHQQQQQQQQHHSPPPVSSSSSSSRNASREASEEVKGASGAKWIGRSAAVAATDCLPIAAAAADDDPTGQRAARLSTASVISNTDSLVGIDDLMPARTERRVDHGGGGGGGGGGGKCGQSVRGGCELEGSGNGNLPPDGTDGHAAASSSSTASPYWGDAGWVDAGGGGGGGADDCPFISAAAAADCLPISPAVAAADCLPISPAVAAPAKEQQEREREPRRGGGGDDGDDNDAVDEGKCSYDDVDPLVLSLAQLEWPEFAAEDPVARSLRMQTVAGVAPDVPRGVKLSGRSARASTHPRRHSSLKTLSHNSSTVSSHQHQHHRHHHLAQLHRVTIANDGAQEAYDLAVSRANGDSSTRRQRLLLHGGGGREASVDIISSASSPSARDDASASTAPHLWSSSAPFSQGPKTGRQRELFQLRLLEQQKKEKEKLDKCREDPRRLGARARAPPEHPSSAAYRPSSPGASDMFAGSGAAHGNRSKKGGEAPKSTFRQRARGGAQGVKGGVRNGFQGGNINAAREMRPFGVEGVVAEVGAGTLAGLTLGDRHITPFAEQLSYRRRELRMNEHAPWAGRDVATAAVGDTEEEGDGEGSELSVPSQRSAPESSAHAFHDQHRLPSRGGLSSSSSARGGGSSTSSSSSIWSSSVRPGANSRRIPVKGTSFGTGMQSGRAGCAPSTELSPRVQSQSTVTNNTSLNSPNRSGSSSSSLPSNNIVILATTSPNPGQTSPEPTSSSPASSPSPVPFWESMKSNGHAAGEQSRRSPTHHPRRGRFIGRGSGRASPVRQP